MAPSIGLMAITVVFGVSAISSILMLTGLALETWVRADYTARAPTRVGLLRTCEGSNCLETEFTRLSICKRFGNDVSTRMNAVVAFFSLFAILFAISAVIVCREVFFVKAASRGYVYLDPNVVRTATVLIQRSAVPWVALAALTAGLVCAAIAFIIFDRVTENWLNCGQGLCASMRARTDSTVVSCGRSYSFHLAIAAVSMGVLALVVCFAWAVHTWRLRRAIPAAVQDAVERREARRRARMAASYAGSLAGSPRIRSAAGSTGSGHGVRPAPRPVVDDRGPSGSPVAFTADIGTRPYHDGAATDGYDGAHEAEREHRLVHVASSHVFAPEPRHRGRSPSASAAVVAVTGDAEPPQCPLEGDWVYSERTLFWSETQGLYYDASSQNFYDPEIDGWYDPHLKEWFTLAQDGTRAPYPTAHDSTTGPQHLQSPGEQRVTERGRSASACSRSPPATTPREAAGAM